MSMTRKNVEHIICIFVFVMSTALPLSKNPNTSLPFFFQFNGNTLNFIKELEHHNIITCMLAVIKWVVCVSVWGEGGGRYCHLSSERQEYLAECVDPSSCQKYYKMAFA